MRSILQQPAEALGTTALEARTWETFALGNAAIQTDIPAATIERLLQIHWAWIAPMFNWVYRPAFMRELHRSFPTPSVLSELTITNRGHGRWRPELLSIPAHCPLRPYRAFRFPRAQ
jgi:hypothetical protein